MNALQLSIRAYFTTGAGKDVTATGNGITKTAQQWIEEDGSSDMIGKIMNDLLIGVSLGLKAGLKSINSQQLKAELSSVPKWDTLSDMKQLAILMYIDGSTFDLANSTAVDGMLNQIGSANPEIQAAFTALLQVDASIKDALFPAATQDDINAAVAGV